MNTLSLKEKAVVAILGAVLLYVIAALTWFLYAEGAWAKAFKAYDKAKATYARECALIARKAQIYQAYDDEKSQMPTFQSGRSTDTTWLEKMDEIARRNNVFLSDRQGGRETVNGDVLELPIDVKNWEGGLESLVKFMHELENTDEGMFDIGSLNFKPSSKKGYLRGSFTLTCAYMRDDNQEE